MTARTKTNGTECCKVESIVSVDERGQMVLPKEVRDAAGIRPGDKMALIMWKKGEDVCCLSLIKVDALTGMVKGLLGPLMKELV
ncbi:MAG: HgcAB-associated protein [Clostridiales bacterium]|nr:HgcAB-associated protein [Clostridiales bacterium]